MIKKDIYQLLLSFVCYVPCLIYELEFSDLDSQSSRYGQDRKMDSQFLDRKESSKGEAAGE